MASAVKDEQQASQTWTAARQARATVNKRLAELDSCIPEVIEGVFQAVEESMAHFRLQCMGTFFLNIELAQEKDVEEILWQTHTKINQTYRKVLGQLRKGQKTNVVRNKVEKRYLSYLKISQQFYKGFIQRLASRFIIPEIEEVCHSFGLKTLQEKERVDPVAANIDGNIFKSCYNTLIHLGDLSRYRYQQSQRGIDSGITYYSLAQKLNPDDGTAHHQMGVLYNEQGRHLEITYHFYRATVCKKPHPNAIKNLQIEFKRALDPDLFNKRKGNNNSAQEALRSWFVRLHANFHKGQKFQEYDELENEVVHRLGLAWKSNENPQALLQMLLVNFAAYHQARKSVTGEWTMTRSRFCQFALRLIVRTTLSLSEAIHTEIMNLADDRTRLSPNGNRSSSETFTPLLTKLLPLFRISCAWLVYHRHDVVQYEEQLEPYISDMYRMVAKAQTSFANAFTDSCPDPDNIATYLLSEDQETAGFLAMDNKDVFYALRFHFDRDGKRKPRRTEEVEVSATKENWWRVRDVLNCGLFLVGDPKFPLQLVCVKGVSEMICSKDTPVIPDEPSPTAEKTGAFDEALDLLRQKSPQAQPGIEPTTSPIHATELKSPQVAVASLSTTSPSFTMPQTAQPHKIPIGTHARIPSQHNSVPMGPPHTQSTPVPQPIETPTLASEETDESLENQMVNMVDDLVASEAIGDKPQVSQDTSSYALGDTTAELLSKLKSPDKVFPSLPWNYFLNSPSHQSFGGQSSYLTQTQQGNSDVYQQIYGGSSAFGSSSTKSQGSSVPGWTNTKVRGVGSLPQWGSSPAHAHSPSAPGMSTKTSGNIWGPNPTTTSNTQAQAQTPVHSLAIQWAPSSTKPSGAGGLIVPEDTPKPASHTQKTSQGDYDMLYQRLAGMASAARDSNKTIDASQKSPATAGNSNLTPGKAFSQTQTQRTGMSPAHGFPPGMRSSSFSQRKPQIVGVSSLGDFQHPSDGSAFESNPWPQYSQQSYSMASPTNAGFGTAPTVGTGVAVATTTGMSSYLPGSGTTGMNTNMNMKPNITMPSFPASDSSSIWASTPTNGRGYDTAVPATSPYSNRGSMGISPSAMAPGSNMDDPTAYRNKVLAAAWGTGGQPGHHHHPSGSGNT